ncbi:unnamed protein product [Effrenium voratum]|nr:unnamed protein product [Effrenium voratum]
MPGLEARFATRKMMRRRSTETSAEIPLTQCPAILRSWVGRKWAAWKQAVQERQGKTRMFKEVRDLKHSTTSKYFRKEQKKYADHIFGRIAGHRYFEGVTMVVILLNALCIGIDADYSARFYRPANLYQGPIFFIVTELFFAVYFTLELFLRFLGFKRKRRCFVDFWFIFDFFLVLMMDIETFLLPLIQSQGSPLAMLSTLRLLRLLRVSRMAKLMKTFPELMLIVKGLAAAVRAVSWTLVLLMMILFVWSIIFTSIYHQGTATDEEVAEGIGSLFGNMSKSAFSLIIMGILVDDVTYCCNMIRESGQLIMLAVFIVFIVISSFMMLNMLLGILVEVVANTAEGEKTKEKNTVVREAMAAVLNDLGVGTGITRDEFLSMSNNKKMIKDLQELGIKQKHFKLIAKLLFDKDVEKKETPKVLTGEEIVSELFRLQPGTPLNFSDLASTEKKLMDQRKELKKRISQIEHLVAIAGGKTISTSSVIPLSGSGVCREGSSLRLLKKVSQESEATDVGNAASGKFSNAKVSLDTLARLRRIDSRDIIDEINRRFGLEDLEMNGVPLDWFDDDLKEQVSGKFE